MSSILYVQYNSIGAYIAQASVLPFTGILNPAYTSQAVALYGDVTRIPLNRALALILYGISLLFCFLGLAKDKYALL